MRQKMKTAICLFALLILCSCATVVPAPNQDQFYLTYVGEATRAYEDGIINKVELTICLDHAWRYLTTMQGSRFGKAATEFRGDMERYLQFIRLRRQSVF